jgi:hypothetical protein
MIEVEVTIKGVTPEPIKVAVIGSSLDIAAAMREAAAAAERLIAMEAER